jgi:hypothetical protein
VFFRPHVSKLSLPMIEEARRADGAVAVLSQLGGARRNRGVGDNKPNSGWT